MYKTISIQHQLPTNIIIAGSTNTGKSVLALDLIKHRHILFDKPIKSCVYIYGEWNKSFDSDNNKDIIFSPNLLDIDKYYLEDDYILVVLDDLFIRMNNDSTMQQYICELFTQKSHHKKVIPVLITHSLFSPSIRTISLNTQIFILLKQVRDKSTYVNFAKQCYPKHPSFILDALEDATANNPFGFILLDLNVRSDNELRCRNFLFPHDNMKIYSP
jgi:hypothetical protein